MYAKIQTHKQTLNYPHYMSNISLTVREHGNSENKPVPYTKKRESIIGDARRFQVFVKLIMKEFSM